MVKFKAPRDMSFGECLRLYDNPALPSSYYVLIDMDVNTGRRMKNMFDMLNSAKLVEHVNNNVFKVKREDAVRLGFRIKK